MTLILNATLRKVAQENNQLALTTSRSKRERERENSSEWIEKMSVHSKLGENPFFYLIELIVLKLLLGFEQFRLDELSARGLLQQFSSFRQ